MAEVAEYLQSKCKTVNSNPSTAKGGREGEREEEKKK
jgi:hypothetical protein